MEPFVNNYSISKLLGERIVAINYKVGQKLKKLRANEEKINI